MVQTTATSTDTNTTTTSCSYPCPYLKSKAEQGWECPRCGRINAPWAKSCDCTRGTYYYDKWTITPTWTDGKWWKTHVTCTQADANTYINKDKVETGGSDYYDTSAHVYTNSTKNVSNHASYPNNNCELHN